MELIYFVRVADISFKNSLKRLLHPMEIKQSLIMFKLLSKHKKEVDYNLDYIIVFRNCKEFKRRLLMCVHVSNIIMKTS